MMRTRWTCPLCGTSVIALGGRRLRELTDRHEVECGSRACLAWHDEMRAQHRATTLIDPAAPQSGAAYLVDLRHKVSASA